MSDENYGAASRVSENRIIACITAFKGIDDPAAALKSALELASMCRDYLGSSAIRSKGQEVFKLLGGVG